MTTVLSSPLTRTTSRRRVIAALAATAMAATLALTGCSGATQSMPGGPVVAPEPAALPGGDGSGAASDGREVAPAAGGGQGAQNPYATGAERQIARTASLTLVVDDVPGTADRIRGIAESLDGWVANESLLLDDDQVRSSLSGSWVYISVPASRLDQATEQVAALGIVRNRGTSSQDVTDAVVDLDARIRSLEASVTRLQELVGRAGSVADIAAVERELSARQAELESLKSQRLQLAGAVERATLGVSLLTPTQSTTTNPLQTGWARGWAAFLESVAVLITVVGAVLPFAALAAVIVVPLLWWRRRRAVRRSARSADADGLGDGVGARQQDRTGQQTGGERDAQDRPEDAVGDEDERHGNQRRDEVGE